MTKWPEEEKEEEGRSRSPVHHSSSCELPEMLARGDRQARRGKEETIGGLYVKGWGEETREGWDPYA